MNLRKDAACWMLAVISLAACGNEPLESSRTRRDAGTLDSGDEGATGDARVRSDARPPANDGDGGPSPACVNLQCQQYECPNGGTTSISGTIFDPAGNNPLYNVAVFVPNSEPEPFVEGATCDRCDSLYTGNPVAATLTDAAGQFKLDNAPAGSDIPLVIQIGKWRRQFRIPTVTQCRDNAQANGTLRLPRNRTEGDIPKIAVSTGGADTLECLLRRVGLDASEYAPGPNAEARIHIYRGESSDDDEDAPNTSPGAPSSQGALWNTRESLMRYDIVLLSCEGEETNGMNQQALHDYASAGGRVFASHYHYAWFNTGPYGQENLATWTPGGNDMGETMNEIVTTLPNGQPFVKGEALAQWLENVGALTGGKLPIEDAKHNADVSADNTPSQAWIVADQDAESPGATQYFSFNTPTDGAGSIDVQARYCGRVVFSDLHVGAASNDDSDDPVPTGCSTRELSPQEAALEFMLFDLSSCIIPDQLPPQPPPVTPII